MTRRVWLGSVLAVGLLLASRAAVAAPAGVCLDANVTETLQHLVDARTLAATTPSGLRLERLDVQGAVIELGYSASVTVVLVPIGSGVGSPQNGNSRFDVQVLDPQGSATKADMDVLLATARAVDAAIPQDAVISNCRPSPGGIDTGPPPHRVPAVVGVGAGFFGIAVVLAALWLGLSFTWRRGKPGQATARDSS